MRQANRTLVLDLIKREGSLSRAEVAKRTGLAKPTVSFIVEELMAEELLNELGTGEASRSGGRRPVLYEFNPRSRYVLGIRIGVEDTTVVLANALGAEVDRASVCTTRATPEAVIATASKIAMELIVRNKIPKHRISAIGVCVAGLVDPATGVCALAPNLGWRDVRVSDLIQGFGRVPIYVHNDVQAVLAAEHLEGAAKDVDNAVVLHEDHGVGAAILIGGRIYHGPSGMAGEVGHCKVPGATERCGCGGIGCLETQVSTTGILRRANALLEGNYPNTRASLRALADQEDMRVAALLREVGEEVGHAASWLVNVVNPEVVLLAGGFLDCGPEFFAATTATVHREALPELASSIEVRVAALDDDAPVRGAVLLAVQASELGANPW